MKGNSLLVALTLSATLAGWAISPTGRKELMLVSEQQAITVDLPSGRAAEADRIGIELAARAGHDPRAAATLWQEMGLVGGGKAPPAFLSIHPSDQPLQPRLGALATKMMSYPQAPGARPTHPVRVGSGAA